MAKIQFDAKMIHDPNKASTEMFYRFDPPCYFDVENEVLDEQGKPVLGEDGKPKVKVEKVFNLDMPESERIWLKKKYLTAQELIKVNTKINRYDPSEMYMPVADVWELTVLEVHGFAQDLKPSDILNAVHSQQAQALLGVSYQDSMGMAKLTDEERKN